MPIAKIIDTLAWKPTVGGISGVTEPYNRVLLWQLYGKGPEGETVPKDCWRCDQ